MRDGGAISRAPTQGLGPVRSHSSRRHHPSPGSSRWRGKDHTVVGFDRFLPPHPPEAECICVDLTSESSVEDAFARVRTAYGENIVSIVHLAAYFDTSGKPNFKYEEVTVRGTERLLQPARKFSVGQFVLTSTMPINEDWPIEAALPYRESKKRAEDLVRDQHRPVPIVIMRPAGIYDGQCHNAFLAHQIARIYEKAPTGSDYPGDLDAGQSPGR